MDYCVLTGNHAVECVLVVGHLASQAVDVLDTLLGDVVGVL